MYESGSLYFSNLIEHLENIGLIACFKIAVNADPLTSREPTVTYNFNRPPFHIKKVHRKIKHPWAISLPYLTMK